MLDWSTNAGVLARQKSSSSSIASAIQWREKSYRGLITQETTPTERSAYNHNQPHTIHSLWMQGEYKKTTPCAQADLPQSILEPILLRVATQNGFKLRWDYEFLTCHEDAETGKVHSTIRDLLSGEEVTVVSNYLCGADGARSVVAREMQLPFQDTPGGGLALNVWFEADLVRLLTSRVSKSLGKGCKLTIPYSRAT